MDCTAVEQLRQRQQLRSMKNVKTVKAVIGALCLGLFSSGCATTGPFKEFAGEIQQLRMGMTQTEVSRLLGRPQADGYFNEVRCKKCWGWDYRRTGRFGQDLHLTIFFKEGRVVDWEEWRPALNL